MVKVEQLIKTVKRYPILYDGSQRNPKETKMKDAVWQSISEELGYDAVFLRKKWKNIRDSYAKHLRAVHCQDSAQAKYRKWQWAKYLTFLKPYITTYITDESDARRNNYDSPDASPAQEEPLECLPIKQELLPEYIDTGNMDQNDSESFTFFNAPSRIIPERDEFSLYGEYIGSRLRNSGRSRIEIAIAQHEIDEICFKLTMGSYAQKNEPDQPNSGNPS